MGIKEFELMPGLECGGVATFLRDALTSRATPVHLILCAPR